LFPQSVEIRQSCAAADSQAVVCRSAYCKVNRNNAINRMANGSWKKKRRASLETLILLGACLGADMKGGHINMTAVNA